MKLYHYAPKENTILTDGIKSFAKHPKNLRAYSRRAGSEKPKDIIKWLDGTFPGRSRAISVLTEPIKPGSKDRTLKYMQKNSVLFSVELDDLIRAKLVESIWCKDGVEQDGRTEKFYPVERSEIDTTPLAWDKVDSDKELLYAVVRHYLLVMKKGVIPAKYIRQERQKFNFVSWIKRLFKTKQQSHRKSP